MQVHRLILCALAAWAAADLPASRAGTISLVPFAQSWRYNQTGSNLSGVFQLPGYDDTGAGWASGQGLLGYETSNPFPYPLPILTTLTTNSTRVTFYFRTHFQCPTNPAGLWLTLSNYVDDGMVLYLNGAEVYRIRMDAGPVNHQTLASSGAVEGDAVIITLPATNVVQGDNVLAVEVHQSTTNSSDVVFGLAANLTDTPLLPDLVLWGPSVSISFQTKTFAASGDCEVNEGCGTPGTRRLMRFPTETRNLGTADLFLGNPVGNPQFAYDSCHQHYHFDDFAAYRLLDTNEMVVATGHKVGFCLLDGFRWNPAAPGSSKYSCGYQGIQWGWADVYGAGLDCQFIDVTDIPGGRYILELETDPENRIVELNETNNITRVMVDITEPCSIPPTNDAFAAGQTIPYRSASQFFATDCATKQSSEPNHNGNSGGHSLWFRWTPNYTGPVVMDTVGSGFDTIMAVYRGSALNGLTLVASDDDAGGNLASRVATNVTSGTLYHIAVDGYGGASGAAVLSINPGGNDHFTNCVLLSSLAGNIGGSTSAATHEPGEPAHGGNAGSRSIWYCWTAPASGRFFFDTDGSRFDTLLGVYTGASVSSLNLVAHDDDSGSFGASQVSFDAIAGVAYRIAVDGKGGVSGLCRLNWRPEVRFAATQREGLALQMTLTGAPADVCLIYTSFDLQHWTPWLTVTNVTGTNLITDTVTAPQGHRFYWARRLQ